MQNYNTNQTACSIKKSTSGTNPKTQYQVTIDDTQYLTFAFTSAAALSNCAFRYAQETDQQVRLIQYLIKQGKLFSSVVEL